MDTVRITERSQTFSNLAVTLIITGLKTKIFSQLLEHLLLPLLNFFPPKSTPSVLVTREHLLDNLCVLKALPQVSSVYLSLVKNVARYLSLTVK